MVMIEVIAYLVMLVCLFRVWPRLRLFTVLEALVFMEWPVQEVVNHLSLHLGYRLWFWFDQIDILVGVLCAVLVWDEIPLAGWLIAFQQFVVMAHYLLIDSVHDFWHRGAWLFWAAKWLDIFINYAVIWGIMQMRRRSGLTLHTVNHTIRQPELPGPLQ